MEKLLIVSSACIIEYEEFKISNNSGYPKIRILRACRQAGSANS
jgi:hypothetical protein